MKPILFTLYALSFTGVGSAFGACYFVAKQQINAQEGMEVISAGFACSLLAIILIAAIGPPAKVVSR